MTKLEQLMAKGVVTLVNRSGTELGQLAPYRLPESAIGKLESLKAHLEERKAS